MRAAPLPALLLLAPLLACKGNYDQNAGPYALTATEVLRDECGLLPSAEGLWDAELSLAGETVRLRYALEDIQLVGYWLADGRGFTADGSAANVRAVVNGQEVLLDLVSVHLEGERVCATEFDGIVRVRYEARRSILCELWTRYRAVQGNASCTAEP